MPNTTTRLSLQQPLGTDPPSVIRTSETNNTNVLDNAAIYQEGTLVLRPVAAASNRGYLWRTTDSNKESLTWSDGTQWISLGLIPGAFGVTMTAIPGQLILASTVTTMTVNLPTSVAGAMIGVVNVNSGVTTVAAAAATLVIPGAISQTQFNLSIPGSYAIMVGDGASWYVVAGGPTVGMITGGGKTNIAAAQSTSSGSFVTLATPDQVTGVVLPTDGLITVWYHAKWQESVGNAAAAAIFLGANQVQATATGVAGNPTQQSALITGTPNNNYQLTSFNGGLFTDVAGTYGTDVTTGQVMGAITSFPRASPGIGVSGAHVMGGPCHIWAAAGTYTVSIQFSVTSGSCTVTSRRLWVQAQSFS